MYTYIKERYSRINTNMAVHLKMSAPSIRYITPSRANQVYRHTFTEHKQFISKSIHSVKPLHAHRWCCNKYSLSHFDFSRNLVV